MAKLLEELKRRNVFRMAIAYGITAWLMLQVADLGLQAIAAPDWVMRAFMLAFALGLPFVLIFSWVFELTPEGIKREREVTRDESVTHETGRKLNFVIIGMLGLVLALMLYQTTLAPRGDTAPIASSPSALDENSIAVLAFENMSDDADQGYFADGLSEELLNKLAKIPELKVAGRTSSFAFKGQNRDLREIGEILNVSYILEGSVRRSADQIRVTAQLIDASEGFHLFSETYDGELKDIFAVQDDIAEQISATLLAELTGSTPELQSATTDPEGYALYLRARQDILSRDFARLTAASALLDRALTLDPAYAPALVQKALVTYLLSDVSGAYGDVPVATALPESQRLISLALAIDDSLPEAHAVNGLLLDETGNNEEALIALERALRLNPSSSEAATWLSSLLATIGETERALSLLEQAVARDPLFGPAFNNLVSNTYMPRGQFDKAFALIDRVASITGENRNVRHSKGTVNLMAGELARANRLLESVYVESPGYSVNTNWYGFSLMALGEYERLAEIAILEQRITARAFLRDANALREEIAALDSLGRLTGDYVQAVCRSLISFDDAQGCIDFVNKHAGSLSDLLREAPLRNRWGTSYVGHLAYAYLQVGDTDNYELAVSAMRQAQDALRRNGAKSWVFERSVIQLAALEGDSDTALSALTRAVEGGGLRVPFEWREWWTQHIKDDPEFMRLREFVNETRDAERAKLNLPPFSEI